MAKARKIQEHEPDVELILTAKEARNLQRVLGPLYFAAGRATYDIYHALNDVGVEVEMQEGTDGNPMNRTDYEL